MANKNTNFTVLFDAQLRNSNEIQKQLDGLKPKVKIQTDIGDSAKKVEELTGAGKQLGLTYQQANEILSKTGDVIQRMTEQVFEMDSAITEFRKVSSYAGEELDAYVSKLTNLGDAVARTG